MQWMKRFATLTLALLVLAGCSTQRPVLNPHEQVPASSSVNQSQMQAAILAALKERGWTALRVTPTDILATITVRNRHSATVNISYSPIDYQIQYQRSSGLDYEDGEIHRNYNRWVKNLSDAILRQLPPTGA